MEHNYTPLKTKKKSNLNAILIAIATLTVVILAVVLYLLVQKNAQEEMDARKRFEIITPTVAPTIFLTPIPLQDETSTQSATASSSATLDEPILGTPSATISPTSTP